jgi:exocyst complex protein 7
MRGSWNRKGLETYGKRVIDRAETVDSVGAGREFGNWVNNLMIVAEVSIQIYYFVFMKRNVTFWQLLAG